MKIIDIIYSNKYDNNFHRELHQAIKTNYILMKRILFAGFAFLSTALFTSCEDPSNNNLTLETDYFEMDFTVQAADLQGFQIFTEKVFDNELNKIMNEAGITAEMNKSIFIKEAEFRITSLGEYKNFDVLKFAELTLYHDSLGEKKIASLNPVPQGQSIISLELSPDDLVNYFDRDTFLLTAQGFLLERVYEDVDLHARVKFNILTR